LSVSVLNRQSRVPVRPSRLRAVGGRALAALGRSDHEVHVTVVGDGEMRRLHARYLGIRAPTDVLAFDLRAPGLPALLGQVVISADAARRQARRLRLPVALEMDLLLVHGLLHLAGHDDHGARALLSRGRRRPLPARLWSGLLPGS
jgi:probable rRNA maturation factor